MISMKISSLRFLLPLALAASLSAAARLNLPQTALTVSVPFGSNGPTSVLNAFNIGSGALNLQASSSVTWLTATVGQSTSCGLQGSCYPVSVAFLTGTLSTGTYTGVITLSDPNAVDAPQSIAVVVNVGGSVPSNLTFYAAPGGTASATFTTNGPITTQVGNASWLTTTTSSNATTGGYVTTLNVKTTTAMSTGDYNGTVTVSGSSFTPDNKQVAIVLHVTTQPIAQASASSLSFNIPQNTAAQSIPVGVSDAGQGAITVSSVTAAAANSGTWLSASTVSGGVSVKADATGLTPNTYTGTVTIASNGVNGNLVIPVQLIVAAQGAPLASAGGVVNNGTFAAAEPLAQGDIAAVFGSQFTFDAPTAASALPLLTTLDNVQVLVNGKAAPVYYVSAGQINFQVPIDAATGDGTVQVVRNNQAGNLVYANINAQVPRFIVYGAGYGIMTNASGALVGTPTSPVKVGDTIVIYAIGLGPTSPSVPSGTASPSAPLAQVSGTTQVCFGTPSPFSQPPCATPLFTGLTPGFVGLYQINVTIPSAVKSGTTPMSLLLVNNVTSDSVPITIQ